jgi:hypothetical protein
VLGPKTQKNKEIVDFWQKKGYVKLELKSNILRKNRSISRKNASLICRKGNSSKTE